jgi:hypothetical protein
MKEQPKRFTYSKPGGEESERVLWVLDHPTDSFFGLDLTQFDVEEQTYLITELERITESFNQEVTELGLETCFRRFKEERILGL